MISGAVRKGLWGILLFVVAGGQDPALSAGSAQVDWLTRFSVAMEEAALTRRPVLLTFYTSWCGWCRKLEQTTFRDPGFVELTQHLVPVRVDGDRERGLAAMYKVRGYPTTVILSRKGKELGRIRGYRKPADFVSQVMGSMSRREPLEEVRNLARANPRDPEAQYALGDVLLALGEYDAAREAFDRVLTLGGAENAGTVEDAELDRALTYLFAYDFAKAVPLLETFLRGRASGPRQDEALFFYGLALIRTGRTAEGLARIDEAAAVTSMEYIRFEAGRLKSLLAEDDGRG